VDSMGGSRVGDDLNKSRGMAGYIFRWVRQRLNGKMDECPRVQGLIKIVDKLAQVGR
jgi:hypothetical protein